MARPTLSLAINADAARPLYLQIADGVAAAVRKGALPPGTRLPGTRALAAQLGTARKTVVAAFDELTAQGWIVGRPDRGTFVASAVPEIVPASASAPAAGRLGFDFRAPADPPFEEPATAVLDFGDGAPDGRIAPIAEIARAFRTALIEAGATPFTGMSPRGHRGLREALAAMLVGTRGLAVAPDDLLVTRGSLSALSLAAEVVLAPGDRVAVESPGYRPAWDALRRVGAECVPVPVDADGIDVQALASIARAGPLRAVYVTPHHQYPTTVTLPAGRRMALLDTAVRERLIVFEDDYDHEYRYRGRPVAPVACDDRGGNVIYMGSLSKMLAPGLRVGYVTAPRPVLNAMVARRVRIDRFGDPVLEAAVGALMADGALQRHVKRARRVYAARRDALTEALRRAFGDRVAVEAPDGGLALWLKLTRERAADWVARARSAGIRLRPPMAPDGAPPGVEGLRLGFAALNEPELSAAVARLARAVG